VAAFGMRQSVARRGKRQGLEVLLDYLNDGDQVLDLEMIRPYALIVRLDMTPSCLPSTPVTEPTSLP